MRESQRGHGVIADAGGEDAERAIDGRVRIAADDDVTGRPQAAFDDRVMNAAAAAIEHVADAVFCGELAHRGEGLGGLLRRGAKL